MSNIYKYNNKLIKNSLLQQKKEIALKIEKRKRFQAYKSLNYFMPTYSSFDFCTDEVITIIAYCFYIKEKLKLPKITWDILVASCIENSISIKNILEKHKFTKENLFNQERTVRHNYLAKSFYKISKKSDSILKGYKNNSIINREFLTIMTKFLGDAIYDHKVPIVTTEMIILRILEERTDIIDQFIRNDSYNYHSLVHHLFKRIHNDESNIKNELTSNHYLFGYLLKLKLSFFENSKLLNIKCNRTATLFFRNKLIRITLGLNLLNNLKRDIYNLIPFTSKRSYFHNK